MNRLTDSTASVSLSNMANTRLLLTKMMLNDGGEEELVLRSYEKDGLKMVIFYLMVVLSLGLVLLLIYWKPELECYLKKRRCALYKAEVVMIKDHYGHASVVKVDYIFLDDVSTAEGYNRHVYHDAPVDVDDTTVLVTGDSPTIRYFDFQQIRYIWDAQQYTFRKLEDLSSGTRCATIHDEFPGLSASTQAHKRLLHGLNSIVIEVKSYWRLFIEEVLNPFYIFQVCSIILWAFDEYYYYASCIFLISLISISVSLYETKRQSQTLSDMVGSLETNISVCRGGQEFEEIPNQNLVPGDLIAIPPHGCVMMCDAVLVAGTCIVNESMLTGESVPVTKTPLSHQEDEEVYTPENHKRHTLFAGTHVVQTRYYGQAKVLAVVVRTGFNTAKGELVRAILYPKPLGFKFYQDAMRFILFLAVVASLGMIYSIIIETQMGAYPGKIVLRVLDIITIVVPPALPAAMTVGTVYAQNRLKKAGIFCISPPRINFCGRINTFCFDKTGTLTEDGLDMWGVVPAQNQCFQEPIRKLPELPRSQILVCMATCHSLTLIDGELMGDPLDLIMFNSLNWSLEEPGQDNTKYDTLMPTIVKPSDKDSFISDEVPFEVGIVRQFTFSSSMQRMSVITRTLGHNHMEIYSKGAPEKIASLCNPETVPENFQPVLHTYTVQGLRVIALAYRPLEAKVNWHQVQRISRDKVECNLTFLGLLVMQNQLKPETTPVIRTLLEAKLRTVMVTGDMIQTAVSVSRNCGMVQPRDKVVIVNAHPPDKQQTARIEWEYAELPTDIDIVSEQDTDIDSDAGQDSRAALLPPESVVVNASSPLLSPGSESRMTAVKLKLFRRDQDGRACCRKGYRTVNVSDEGPRHHLAITGKSFAVITAHFPEMLEKICTKGTVFARMSPEQKCQLIQNLQKLDYIVGMCGDGANDCEALKAAHAGISLSEAEASVAAPFTSRISNIECVVTAMREGRAALVTSFGCFKYMALYSFIQFVSVLILYTFGANLSDFEFLYIDLVITTTIAVLMGYTGPYHKLVRKKPPGSLVKVSNLLSIIMQVLLVGGMQVSAYFYLRSQSWYEEPPPSKDLENVQSWESTVIFLVSSYMYISVAFCFSKGPPFRKPIYTNYPFLISMMFLFGFSTFLLLLPLPEIEHFLEMKELHEKSITFRLYLFGFAVAFAIMSSFMEYMIVDSSMLKPCYKAIKKRGPQNRYKVVENEIKNSDWPPVGQVTFPTTNAIHVSDIHVEMNSQSAIH
ncbi:polyamine-transporting ATPase 13A3-like isoform X1 [Haliotis cracherodii]|uniref:polyamine-transporting ATPase 13A3-like isoform X1 n=1 Tax=Haliotis cracherodii TaxID=6455 RepID=UPI0039E86845